MKVKKVVSSTSSLVKDDISWRHSETNTRGINSADPNEREKDFTVPSAEHVEMVSGSSKLFKKMN